ncbi:MAG: hypothetical protein ACD_4C00170G0001, partial [uncultured bacterium (gcode 4)]
MPKEFNKSILYSFLELPAYGKIEPLCSPTTAFLLALSVN